MTAGLLISLTGNGALGDLLGVRAVIGGPPGLILLCGLLCLALSRSSVAPRVTVDTVSRYVHVEPVVLSGEVVLKAASGA